MKISKTKLFFQSNGSYTSEPIKRLIMKSERWKSSEDLPSTGRVASLTITMEGTTVKVMGIFIDSSQRLNQKPSWEGLGRFGYICQRCFLSYFFKLLLSASHPTQSPCLRCCFTRRRVAIALKSEQLISWVSCTFKGAWCRHVDRTPHTRPFYRCRCS